MNVPGGGPLHGLVLVTHSGGFTHDEGFRSGARRSWRLRPCGCRDAGAHGRAGQRAEALSLINPGAAPSAKYASDGLTTEVRGGAAAMAAVFRAAAVAAFAAAEVAASVAVASAAAVWPFMAVVSAAAGPCSAAAATVAAPGIVRHHHVAPRRAYFIIATTSARATATRRLIITRAGSAGWSGPITVRARSAAIARGTTTGAIAIACRSTGELRTG